MKKLAITLSKRGTEEKVLKVFDTKREALNAGPEYRKVYTREDGLLSCISGNFDEHNNRVDNSCIFYTAWI